ncbi:MAG: bifunctional 5,10-methylenetetrahydrofolate dehydrogenase/5,10-methenyltetrahydrofolate cyclohydrolase [Candidatus Omnitrophota bacterium]
MPARLLDGKQLAHQLKQDLCRETALIRETYQKVPLMCNILIGDDPGARYYANSQKRVAEEIGIDYIQKAFPAEVTQGALSNYLDDLNDDPAVTGIMVHKPVPDHIHEQSVFNELAPLKDIEGMNSLNIGNVLLGKGNIIPCTAAAVMAHLDAADISLRGKEVVIVGASEIVGKPLAMLCLAKMATVTVCHIATSEAGRLDEHVKRADVVIVAVGKPGLITGAMIKDGAVVIDVGINKVAGGIVGDVDFESAVQHAGSLTPVPGGVGPVTVIMLMRNIIESFYLQQEQIHHTEPK